MKIIDKYVAKDFLRYFFISIIVFTCLFILVDILQRSFKEGLSWPLLKYTLLQIPFVISQMVPMACLIASMFVLTSLAKNSELIALNACGISLERISLMILYVAIMIGMANFLMTDAIVPPTLKYARYVYNVDVKKQASYQLFKTNRIWYRSQNAIYNIDNFNAGNQSIDGINIYLFDDAFTLTEQITAKKALYNGQEWILQEGQSTSYLDEFPVAHQFKMKQAEYIIEKPEDLKEIGNLETMQFKEIKDYIQKNKRAGFDTIRHEVNLHAKIAYVIACLIMAFLGIPFSAKNPRSGGLALSFGTGLAIAFFYWMCLNAGLSFGYSRALPPIISAWITNIMFAIFGFYFLKRQQKQGSSWLF